MLRRDAELLWVLAEGKGSEALGSRRGTYLFTAVIAFCAVSLVKQVKVKQYSTSEATCLCVVLHTASLT